MILTEPFQGLAANFAATLGMPGYHNVLVPHPIASKDEVELHRLASRVVDTVVQQLAEND